MKIENSDYRAKFEANMFQINATTVRAFGLNVSKLRGLKHQFV